MNQNNKGFTIVEIVLFLLVITIVVVLGYRFVHINSDASSKLFSMGEQFTLSIDERAEVFYEGDNLLLQLTDVSLSECYDNDYYGAGSQPCTPSEHASYNLSVNGSSESYSAFSNQTMNGERQGYGVVVLDFKLGESATFVVDTLLKTCSLIGDLADGEVERYTNYNRCVNTSAYSQKMFDWCGLLPIDDYPSRSYCQERVAMLLDDKSMCGVIDNPEDYCIVDEIIQSGDIKSCYRLLSYKDRCIQKIAQEDPSKCDEAPQENGPYVSDVCRALLEPNAVQY